MACVDILHSKPTFADLNVQSEEIDAWMGLITVIVSRSISYLSGHFYQLRFRSKMEMILQVRVPAVVRLIILLAGLRDNLERSAQRLR